MIKKETINGLEFEEVITFKVKQGNEVLLETDSEDKFLKKKNKAIQVESEAKKDDLSSKAAEREKEALQQISTKLKEKLDEHMKGNISELARQCGISNITLTSILKGETNPSIGNLIKIFTPLHTEIREIFQ